jgi:hypothetical protein
VSISRSPYGSGSFRGSSSPNSSTIMSPVRRSRAWKLLARILGCVVPFGWTLLYLMSIKNRQRTITDKLKHPKAFNDKDMCRQIRGTDEDWSGPTISGRGFCKLSFIS